MEGYLTVKEACKKYEICERTLRRWANIGRVEKYRDPFSGRVYYIPPKHDLIRIEQVQEILGCSRRHVYDLVFSGQLHPALGFDKTWFIPEDVALYLAKRQASLKKELSAAEMVASITPKKGKER